MSRMMKFQIYSNRVPRHQQWRWRLTAANGKILCASSESFASKANCKANAGSTMVGLGQHRGEMV